jgi:hypothetical protein
MEGIMGKLIIPFLIIFFAIGCATTKAPDIQVVEIPVPLPCPEPPRIPSVEVRPVTFTPPLYEEAVSSLTKHNLQNLLMTIGDMLRYIRQMEEALKAYKIDGE